MKEFIKKAKFLIKENKVVKVSDTLWQIDDKEVKLHRKPGRSYFTCSCENHARFCNENPNCKHKFAVILFESNFEFNKKIDSLVKLFKKSKELNMPLDVDVSIQSLEDLKFLK